MYSAALQCLLLAATSYFTLGMATENKKATSFCGHCDIWLAHYVKKEKIHHACFVLEKVSHCQEICGDEQHPAIVCLEETCKLPASERTFPLECTTDGLAGAASYDESRSDEGNWKQDHEDFGIRATGIYDDYGDTGVSSDDLAPASGRRNMRRNRSSGRARSQAPQNDDYQNNDVEDPVYDQPLDQAPLYDDFDSEAPAVGTVFEHSDGTLSIELENGDDVEIVDSEEAVDSAPQPVEYDQNVSPEAGGDYSNEQPYDQGYNPEPVQGYNPELVQGYNPDPVQEYAPLGANDYVDPAAQEFSQDQADFINPVQDTYAAGPVDDPYLDDVLNNVDNVVPADYVNDVAPVVDYPVSGQADLGGGVNGDYGPDVGAGSDYLPLQPYANDGGGGGDYQYDSVGERAPAVHDARIIIQNYRP